MGSIKPALFHRKFKNVLLTGFLISLAATLPSAQAGAAEEEAMSSPHTHSDYPAPPIDQESPERTEKALFALG